MGDFVTVSLDSGTETATDVESVSTATADESPKHQSLQSPRETEIERHRRQNKQGRKKQDENQPVQQQQLKRLRTSSRKFNCYRKRKGVDKNSENCSVKAGKEPALVEKFVYQCTECRFWSRTANRFHIHFVEHREIQQFECTCCSFSAARRQSVWNHIHKVSKTDGFHKRATCRMLSVTPTERYASYLKAAQVPPTAYCGLLSIAPDNSIEVVSPAKVNDMKNAEKTAETLETTMDISTPSSDGKPLSIPDCPVSVTYDNTASDKTFTVVLEQSSGSSLPIGPVSIISPVDKEEQSSKRKRVDSFDKNVERVMKKSDKPNSLEALQMDKEKLLQEQIQLEIDNKTRYGALDSLKSDLEKGMLMWTEQKQKIHAFEREKGDTSDHLKMACLQADCEKTQDKMKLRKKEKLCQELELRQQQKDNLETEMRLMELDEDTDKYTDVEEQLAQGKKKEESLEIAIQGIDADIFTFQQEEQEFNRQVGEMEIVINELSSMEATETSLQNQLLNLQKKREDIISDIKKHTQDLVTIQLKLVQISREEELIAIEKKCKEAVFAIKLKMEHDLSYLESYSACPQLPPNGTPKKL